MPSVHIAVRDGVRTDVTEALPEAIREEFGDSSVTDVEEDKARTEAHEIRPFLPSVRFTLNETIDKSALQDVLDSLQQDRDCTFELRSWEATTND